MDIGYKLTELIYVLYGHNVNLTLKKKKCKVDNWIIWVYGIYWVSFLSIQIEFCNMLNIIIKARDGTWTMTWSRDMRLCIYCFYNYHCQPNFSFVLLRPSQKEQKKWVKIQKLRNWMRIIVSHTKYVIISHIIEIVHLFRDKKNIYISSSFLERR